MLGLTGGLAAGVVFGRAARSRLFEIAPGHPGNLAASAFAITLAVVAAMLPPAARASRIDPAETLRSE